MSLESSDSDHLKKAASPLDMKLPVKERAVKNEGTEEMLDRIKKWEVQFKQSAEQALMQVYGFRNAKVKDFRWLGEDAGHDENDYELTVQLDSNPVDAVGDESGMSVVIVVRRAESDSLRS